MNRSPQASAGCDKHVVSIDGLQAEHDLRRAPAPCERIISNIAIHQIAIHCTITGQMMNRAGYPDDFLQFWTPRPQDRKLWFSIFTPQKGANTSERLMPSQRKQAIADLAILRKHYPELDMPESMIRQFSPLPPGPGDRVFPLTTKTVSANLKTVISSCQFGGNPDCSSCGCIASIRPAAIDQHKLGGVTLVSAIFRASLKVCKIRSLPAVQESKANEFQILQ